LRAVFETATSVENEEVGQQIFVSAFLLRRMRHFFLAPEHLHHATVDNYKGACTSLFVRDRLIINLPEKYCLCLVELLTRNSGGTVSGLQDPYCPLVRTLNGIWLTEGSGLWCFLPGFIFDTATVP
jgi:hypothetical protein